MVEEISQCHGRFGQVRGSIQEVREESVRESPGTRLASQRVQTARVKTDEVKGGQGKSRTRFWEAGGVRPPSRPFPSSPPPPFFRLFCVLSYTPTITFYLRFTERHIEIKPVAKSAQLRSSRAVI